MTYAYGDQTSAAHDGMSGNFLGLQNLSPPIIIEDNPHDRHCRRPGLGAGEEEGDLEHHRETLDEQVQWPLLEPVAFALTVSAALDHRSARIPQGPVQPLFSQTVLGSASGYSPTGSWEHLSFVRAISRDRSNLHFIFPTLAFQLATQIPDILRSKFVHESLVS